MQELESGFVAVADGCTEVHKTENMGHTVIGVFYSVEDAKQACTWRAAGCEDPLPEEYTWDDWPDRGKWSSRSESGETGYGITQIGYIE